MSENTKWKKVCKVCNKDVNPDFLGEHEKCLNYEKIIRNVKI